MCLLSPIFSHSISIYDLWARNAQNFVLLPCFIDACVLCDKTHRIVSSNFTKLDFIRIKFTLSKTKHGTQTWRFGRWLFSFSKGGDFGLFGRERCFLHWNTNHLSGFAKTVMTSPGCQKSRWLQTKLRTSRRHTRKAEMECPPSSCWQIPDGRKIHPQRLGSNFCLQKIQLLKVPYRLRR